MQKSVQGDHAGALQDVDRAIELQPRAASHFVVRAGIHEKLGDLDACIADYKKAIELQPALEPGLRRQLEHLEAKSSPGR